jgi:hypothetical protein
MAIVANRPTGILIGDAMSSPAVLRSITGAVAAESTTRTIAQFAVTLGTKGCRGLDTVLLAVEFGEAGANSTVTIEPLILDTLGSLWMQIMLGAAEGITPIGAPAAVVTPAMSVGQLYEVPVLGATTILFRVHAVGGDAITNLAILGYPGRLRGSR